MQANDLIHLYGKDADKNPGEREVFKVLRDANLVISNDMLCELLNNVTGYDWKTEVCLDSKFGPGPDNHPLPQCYDLILSAETPNGHKTYTLLHEYYGELEKMNKVSMAKLENANWAELFLNAENKNKTLYCGDFRKEPMPKFMQDILTQFMLSLASQEHSTDNSSDATKNESGHTL